MVDMESLSKREREREREEEKSIKEVDGLKGRKV